MTQQRLLCRVSTIGAVPLLAIACSLRQPPPEGASGPQIYELQNCANCHGAGGEGSSLGPALRGLAAWWTRDALVSYLADPRTFVENDPRLKELDERYWGSMSSYDNLTAAQRGVLADWLLALE